MKENHQIWILIKKLGLEWISFYFKIKSFSHFFGSQFFSPDTFHKHKSHFWWIWKFFCRTIHLFWAYLFYNVEYKVQKKKLNFLSFSFLLAISEPIPSKNSVFPFHPHRDKSDHNPPVFFQSASVRTSLVESNGKWRAWAVEIWGMATSSLMGIIMRVVSVHLWNQRIFETLCSNHQSPYHIAGVVVLRIEEHQLIK